MKNTTKRSGNKEEDDAADDSYDEDDDDDDLEDGPPVLIVQTSKIPNAGQGLFLASPRFVPAGTVLIEEDAIAIRRPAAKLILNMPEWHGRQPVIQGSSNKYLDIRLLLIHKANHCPATSPQCNAAVSQKGPARLVMTTRRNVYRGEEILWEYSPTMQEFS